MTWRWNRDRGFRGCNGAYEQTNGVIRSTPIWGSDVPIPDLLWSEALQAMRDVADETIGVTGISVRVDRPGDHDVVLFSADGNQITVGTMKATIIRANSGCRLPEKFLHPEVGN